MRRERLFLADIVEAADAAAGFLIAVDRETFVGSDLVHSAVLQKLIIVGEAARHIDPALRGGAPDVRWRSIIGFRNLVIHGYFDVDWSIVYETATVDLPVLRDQIALLLARLPPDE